MHICSILNTNKKSFVFITVGEIDIWIVFTKISSINSTNKTIKSCYMYKKILTAICSTDTKLQGSMEGSHYDKFEIMQANIYVFNF